MKIQKYYFWLHKKFFKYTFRIIFTIFLVSAFGISYATNEEDGGRIYEHWMNAIFSALPNDFSTATTTGTAKKANTLVDTNGTFSAVVGYQKFGLGDKVTAQNFITSTAHETVQISGVHPKMRISGTTGNPELQLENELGHDSVYFDTGTNEFRVWTQNSGGGQNGIILTPEKIRFPKGATLEGKSLALSFDCVNDGYGNQTFLKGFDDSGNAICEKASIYDWTREEFGACTKVGLTCIKERTVLCKDQDEKTVPDILCASQNKYFPNPPASKRTCPAYMCP